MILVLDAGNSRLKWAWWSPAKGLSGVRAEVRGRRSAHTVLAAAAAQGPRPDRVVACNVAGAQYGQELFAAVAEYWALGLEFIHAAPAAAGVINGYRDPRLLGVDRWAALVAVRQMTSGPACVFDCGSALTVDVLAEDGRHQGGLIAPGPDLMRKALDRDTADVRVPAGEGWLLEPLTAAANNTATAVNNGVRYALLGLIERVAADVAASLPGPLTNVITGGAALPLLRHLHGAFRHEPDLVLAGIARLATAGEHG